jgi:hypothetical protein
LNFVESLSPQDFNVFRSIAIQLVLATDMSRHGEYMKLTADPLWPTGAALPPQLPSFARVLVPFSHFDSLFSTYHLTCHLRRTQRHKASGARSEMR